MWYLIASISCTTILGVFFKVFPKYSIDRITAVIINYLSCSVIGLFFFMAQYSSSNESFQNTSWLPSAIILGAFFILGFNFFGKSIEFNGLAISSTIQKMSIIVSVVVAIVLGDNVVFLQIVGLFLAILSIFLLSLNFGAVQDKIKNKKFLFLAWIMAIGIEVIFISLYKFTSLNSIEKMSFTLGIFFFAFLFGIMQYRSKIKWTDKNSVGFGIALGIPNYFSIISLNYSLQSGIPGSVVFPVLNCAVIFLSILVSYIFFKEKISFFQWIGLVLALVAIGLISYFQNN
ncbi:MAG TPA: EamA family transporter [Saprospiraceae bacterium]|nr:EamA family transporter [Saprospiraceae bacterium]